MQSPNRRSVDAKMNVGSAGLLPNRQVIVNVFERVRDPSGLLGFCDHDVPT